MDFRDLKIDEYIFINFRCLKFRGIQTVHYAYEGEGEGEGGEGGGGGQLNAYVPY